MLLNSEQLKQEAHNSALLHDPYITRKSKKLFLKNMKNELMSLRTFISQLQEVHHGCTHPAEEWLLDHTEFIEEQSLIVKQSLSEPWINTLPNLRNSGVSRVFSVCKNYIEHTEGNLQEESFMSYLQAYQEVSVLSLAEIWASPLMLRVALFYRLAEIMEIIMERREVCSLVERLLEEFGASRITPDKLKQKLQEAGQEMPLSGSVIVHLVKHLRERADDTVTVGEWLVCKLENGTESLDHIMTYEYQLQASLQMITGNLIGSLRNLSRWDWNETFEQVCIVEQTLREENTGDYKRLDFSSRETLRKQVVKLSRRLQLPENLVATQAVELSNKVNKQEISDRRGVSQVSRKAFVAYYLLEPEGIKTLRDALKLCGKPKIMPETGLLRRAKGTYFNMLIIIFLFALCGFALWIGLDMLFLPSEWIFIIAMLVFPALEWAVTTVHWMIERVKSPIPLLRLDFSKEIPLDASTMIVIPVIWSTVDQVSELIDRIELHYLANRNKNIHFALLGDYIDADMECHPEDSPLLMKAKEGIEQLNRKYSDDLFHLFQRRRRWNPCEKVWMGWERKRGKLVEFIELLKGNEDTSFDIIQGNESFLQRVRYIITLDADTQLPLECAHRMIGTLHLPYNQPRLNDTLTRVVEGYGLLQPRIGLTHETAQQSRLAALWSADPGIDPYAFAVADPYQDGLGEGIFTGKGIFDVDVFHQIVCGRIPDNRVLSHDLLEGGFLRVGFLTDIELIDDHPASFSSHQRRLHRWVRGDWQLILWLLPKARNRKGNVMPVDLSILTRWQMIDNLRRSLHLPSLLTILLLSLTVLPGSSIRWFILVLATLLVPLFRQIGAVRSVIQNPKSIPITLGQICITIITLPYQSMVLLDAILRSLVRLLFTKRRLLEWVTAADVDRTSKRNKRFPLQGLFAGVVFIVLFLFAVLWKGEPSTQIFGLSFILLWLSAPLVVRWLDSQPHYDEMKLTKEETAELQELSRQIWSFYEDSVTLQDHWLPPDNVQIEPPNGIAHRTSPTNIGMYLCCTLAARDFGFIDTAGMIERLERTLDTLDRMDKWNGHLYNWYDTLTLDSLHPLYISTVDSGNFVGCLMTLKEGLVEWLEKDKLLDRGSRLVTRIEQWVEGTDFRPLYQHQTKLFSLGYHIEANKLDEVLYDLIASEARQASFIAIALGQVSVSHWHALSRTMTKVGNRPAFLSWSGTMFEYLMPWILMRTYRNSVWDITYSAVIKRQIEYAKQRGIPFGISESGYFAFDYQLNYQYRAFGVPGLGFKRGLELDLVVSPYATILALPYAKNEGLQALKQMDQIGGRGKYGYFEAIDYTRERLPAGQKYAVIRSFMAHHQGMSLLTLANILLPHKMVDRFHRNKQVRAAELLLQERIPIRPKMISHLAMSRTHAPLTKSEYDNAVYRKVNTANTILPEVCVLSNGSFTTMVTGSGSGFSRYKGLSVTRWREDPVRDPWGSYIYIRDVSLDKLWSPSFQPVGVQTKKQHIQFALDHASFHHEDEEVKTRLDICVSPEWNAEVRRLSLTNLTKETKVLEVTTFVEIALADAIADDAHPAFSKLFIRTEFDDLSGCLIAGRRAREAKDTTLWAAHSLIDEQPNGPEEFETDRSSFIGRGHRLSEPQAIRSGLRGTVGSVADPAFIMRRRVTIEPGEQKQLFVLTSVAESKEEAIHIVNGLSHRESVDRAFQMAWNHGQIELRNLNLSNKEASSFQAFAGQIIYRAPLRNKRANSIIANKKGQSGLWAFGVSGDRPIVLVTIESREHLLFIIKLLTGHEYLRRLGLLFDLVILNASREGYQQALQEELQRSAEQSVDRFGEGLSGVYVIANNQLTSDDTLLLQSVARIELRAEGPSLITQIRIPKDDDENLPDNLVPTKPIHEDDTPSKLSGIIEPKDGLFYNGWGGFSADGKEYRIGIKSGKHLPAPWINVLANPRFGCLISELGTGYTWWKNSRECKLTPWSNDPVLDPPTETVYIRDEESGNYWSAAPSAVQSELPYYITHGRGFSRFDHERNGIKHEMTLFVPLHDPVKIVRLKLSNRGNKRRRISLTYYAEWVLGVKRETETPYIVTEWVESVNILTAQNKYQETFRDATAFLGICSNDQAALHTVNNDLSWTSDRNEFIGRNGSMERPASMNRTHLSGRTGTQYDTCGAIQLKLTLEPGSEQTVYILLGCDHSIEAVSSLAQQYSDPLVCEQALGDVIQFWEQILGQIIVSTPSVEANILLNGWLLYQSLACRIWARSAFYQAGGAYGFRDQLQDSLALLHTLPEQTRAQILLNAAHQYKEGDVQHWWHEETKRGIRTLFSDDLLWLPYAVSRYIEHTGDIEILEEMAPYLQSDLLQEGEHERYEATVLSSETGTIYEHCLRAIDKSLQRFGEHGLPLIGVGDWNDGMNLVGAEGRGESVWLGWFICEVLQRFSELCQQRGEIERETNYRRKREQLSASLNEHAWDGRWYRRAFTDAATWLGSVHNDECRIDAIAQSWSVISGAAPQERMLQAMQSFDRELVERDLSVIRLLTPPFDRTEPSPGYIQGYPPGIRENGAQYTHGVIWSIIAWCRLGKGDKAFELFHMLNPLTHTRTDHEVRQYTGEPYAIAADVYTAKPHEGHAGWTWYTGAAGWMYQAGIESIIGIQRRGEQLYINPCIPSEWPEFSVTYQFGKASYFISVTNESGKSTGISRGTLDGKELILMEEAKNQGCCFELLDDGHEHHVELTM